MVKRILVRSANATFWVKNKKKIDFWDKLASRYLCGPKGERMVEVLKRE